MSEQVIGQDVIMQALSATLLQHLPEDAKKALTSSTPSTPYLHGPFGQFSPAGLSRPLIHTHITPHGLAGVLPMVPNDDEYPFYSYITGFQAASGTEKTDACDDPQTAGALKTCVQTAQFGRKEYATRVLEVDRTGLVNNRGEFQDLRLVNSPLIPQLGGLMQQLVTLNGAQALNAGRDMLIRMVEVGVAFQRWLAEYVYIGSPANNNGDGYKEFPGLETLVGTNKVDAFTGGDCPSLYSDVKDMDYSRVDDVNAANNIVNVLTYAYRTRRHKAMEHQMGGVDWRFVMPEWLFYELTAVWPCSYKTYRCIFPNSVGDNGTINLNVGGQEARDMIDAMRTGSFLVIDGRRIPVIVDDAMPFQSSATTSRLNAGEFASDIYLLPFSVRNGAFRTLFWEHRNYDMGPMQAVRDGRFQQFFFSDGGRYLWGVKPPNNWCIQMIAKVEPRIILLTPHLAARITNVAAAPLQMTDQPLTDQPYHVNGGETGGYVPPSPYSDWNLSQ